MNQKYHNQSNQIRYNHLIKQNNKLQSTIRQLQSQNQSISKINCMLINQNQQIKQQINTQIMQENKRVKEECMNLRKNNQELACNLLMNEQLLCEINNEHLQITENYQEKIAELQDSLLRKQDFIVNLQQKHYGQKQNKTRINLDSFNYLFQNSQFERLCTRMNVQNLQLKYLIQKKDEQIQMLSQYIQLIQNTFKKTEAFKIQKKNLKAKITNQFKKNLQRIHLQTQIAKYDNKYKQVILKKMPNHSLNEAKLLLQHLNYKNIIQKVQIENLLQEKNKRNKEYQLLTIAYKKIQQQYFAIQLQLQFYKTNFKQLAKVTSQRKIEFYLQQYSQSLPDVQFFMKNKNNLINYWKQKKFNFMHKCIIKNQLAKNKRQRTNSCQIFFNRNGEGQNKKQLDKKKQNAILSFILQSDSLFDAKIKPRNDFQEDISAINGVLRYYSDYEGQLKAIDLNQ